jgi:hypothetical protein
MENIIVSLHHIMMLLYTVHIYIWKNKNNSKKENENK